MRGIVLMHGLDHHHRRGFVSILQNTCLFSGWNEVLSLINIASITGGRAPMKNEYICIGSRDHGSLVSWMYGSTLSIFHLDLSYAILAQTHLLLRLFQSQGLFLVIFIMFREIGEHQSLNCGLTIGEWQCWALYGFGFLLDEQDGVIVPSDDGALVHNSPTYVQYSRPMCLGND